MIVARFQRIFAVSQAPTWRHRLTSRQGLASSGLCGLLGPSGLAGTKRPVRQGRSSPVVMTWTCDQVSSPFIMRRCQDCGSAPIATVEGARIGTGPAACGCRMLLSRPGEFHPEPLTDPDVILSHHPARATARRLPPSVDEGLFPASRLARSTAMTCPLRSSPITEPSALLRGSPPLSGALVLSALRLTPLAPFPLAPPARFSRSVPEPGRASRRLYAGCRSVSIRSSSELIPEEG